MLMPTTRIAPWCRVLTIVCLSGLALLSLSAWSDDDLPIGDDAAVQQPGDDAAAGSSTTLPERSRIVYIPYDDLNSVLGNSEAGVMVPLQEYLDLRQRAADAAVVEGQDPLPAIITSAHYTGEVDGDFVRIQAELTVNVLGEPWVELPIRFGQAAVGEVSGENDKLFVRGTGDGHYSLMLGESGRHTITLELLVRINTSPDGKQIAFDCPPSPVTTFEFAVPETGQSIDVTPSIVSVPVEQGDGETRIKVNLGATASISAQWHPEAGLKPEMELLVGADNLQQVRISEGQVHTHVDLTYEVLRGTFELLQVSVPLDHRILSVESATRLKGWSVEQNDNEQLVTIEVLEPATSLTLSINTERPLPDGPLSLIGDDLDGRPQAIHPVGVVRENGQIVVDHDSDLEVTVADQSGLLRMDPSQAAPALQGAHALAYRFYGGTASLQIETKPVVPRVIAVQNTQLVFEDDELKLMTDANFTIERSGIFEVRWSIPEGLVIDQVTGDRLRDYRVDEAAGELIATLLDRTQGGLALRITGHVDYEAGNTESELTLPVPEPIGVERETGTVFVFAEESIEVITQEDQVEAALAAPATPGLMVGRGVLVSAWNYTRRPLSIPVTTQRKSTRLSADLATTVNVSPELIEVDSILEFDVEFAGVDTFRFRVPEEVEGLQVEAVSDDPSAPGIKQKTAGEAEEGWVTWTIIMQRDVIGSQRFRLFHEVDAADVVEADSTSVPDDTDTDADTADDADADMTDAVDPDADADAATDDAEMTADNAEAADTEDDAATTDETDVAEVATDDDVTTDANTIPILLPVPLGLEAGGGRDEVPLSRIEGEIVIKQDVTITVSSSATGGDVEAMDVRELKLLPADGSAAYRYHSVPEDGGIEIAIVRSRPEVQEVVETVVSRALVEITTGEDKAAHYHCRYQVRTAERQRIRVDLPKGLRILDVSVAGRESRLEPSTDNPFDDKSFDAFWLDVTRTGGAEEEFLISFQFQWDISDPPAQSDFGRGRLKLPLPILGGRQGSVAVQELRTVIRVPKDYVLVGDPNLFSLTNIFYWDNPFESPESVCDTDGLDAWIGGSSGTSTSAMTSTLGLQAFRYDNLGGAPELEVVWWRRWWMSALFSGAIAIIGLILWRTAWEAKVSLVLVVVLIAAIVGLRDPHAIQHALAASVYGILFVFGLWIVQGGGALFRSLKPAVAGNGGSAAPPSPPAPTSPPHPEAPQSNA